MTSQIRITLFGVAGQWEYAVGVRSWKKKENKGKENKENEGTLFGVAGQWEYSVGVRSWKKKENKGKENKEKKENEGEKEIEKKKEERKRKKRGTRTLKGLHVPHPCPPSMSPIQFQDLTPTVRVEL